MKGHTTNAYLVVILIRSIYAVMIMLSKAAFDQGMNNYIFVFYRQAAGTAFLTPFVFFFARKNAPPLSFVTFCKMFFSSFFGITACLITYNIALIYTSSTLVAAVTNCLPVVTFFLALLLRIEVLKVKTGPGIAKLIAIVTCLGGVAILAFYKGPQFEFHHHLIGYHKSQRNHAPPSSGSWIIGCFLLLLSVTFWGLWLVMQTFINKCYPSKLRSTTLQCFLSTIQAFVIAFAMERDIEQWKLGWNIRLLVVVYCGFMVSGVSYYLQSWVVDKEGPVFLAMSTPLTLIMTILPSAFLLGEIISLGSIIGGLIFILSLFCFLWGKSKEQKHKAPILDIKLESG